LILRLSSRFDISAHFGQLRHTLGKSALSCWI
jgi:hypothetical protein